MPVVGHSTFIFFRPVAGRQGESTMFRREYTGGILFVGKRGNGVCCVRYVAVFLPGPLESDTFVAVGVLVVSADFSFCVAVGFFSGFLL